MPVQLLPHLRLLSPSLPLARLSTMKPIGVKSSYRVGPIFARIFPHKLKYQSLSRKLGLLSLSSQQLAQPQQLGVRRLSTRSGRHRPGSSADVRASKSLIDDEAELSDWVSGLKSDSFRTRLYSSDDDSNGGSARGRPSSDRRRGRDEKGGRDRFPSAKRRRDSDSDDQFTVNRQMGRDSSGPLSRNSNGKARFGSELTGKVERFVSKREENGRRKEESSAIPKRRLRKGSFVASEGEDGNNDEDQGGGSSFKSFRDLISEEDSDDDDDVDMLKAAGPLLATSREASSAAVPASPGRSDSYLSETRYNWKNSNYCVCGWL